MYVKTKQTLKHKELSPVKVSLVFIWEWWSMLRHEREHWLTSYIVLAYQYHIAEWWSYQKKMGNKVLSHYAKQWLVSPPSLKFNLFTTGAFENIDHNQSSTTAEDSFHGTGISLFQHKTHEQNGLDLNISTSKSENKKLSSLPDSYTNIRPVSRFKEIVRK